MITTRSKKTANSIPPNTADPAPADAASPTSAKAARPAPTNNLYPIPGAEVIGRGIYLRPRQPYELKAVLFERGQDQTRLRSMETGSDYLVPAGCEVNQSPPLPMDQSLGETVIEESWDRFSNELALNVNAAVSAKIFSIDPSGFQATSLRSEEDSYYALRSSFIPFWNLYMPSVPRLHTLEEDVMTLPEPFDPSNRAAYARIFDQYGTHYVKSAWVGGKASLVFIVSKSSQITKGEIKVGIQTAFSGVSSTASSTQRESKDKLQSNSSCKVFGSGGDKVKLAALSTLDQAAYTNWLDTVKQSPEVIQLGVAGIWTLVKDPEKAEALKKAYIEETSFTPLTAIVPVSSNWLVFAKDNYVFAYNLLPHKGESKVQVNSPKQAEPSVEFEQDPKKARSKRPNDPRADRHNILHFLPVLMDERFSHFRRPHSACTLYGFGNGLDNKIYLFKWRQCLRITLSNDLNEKPHSVVDEGYPKDIQEDWPGVDFDRIDAAVAVAPDSVYFFRGSTYVRIDLSKDGKQIGTRDLIKRRWAGMIFEKIDTGVYWKNSKVYFFYGDQYIRYDMSTYKADPGYPKFIPSNYVEDWELVE